MGFFLFLEGEFFLDWPRYAPLPRRAACPFPGGEASKEKNMSLKRIFCNKGTLTNKFVGAFITKKLLHFTQELHILFSLAEGGGFEPPVP